ncbi:DUF4377 domain-containing protein [Psychrobacter sp. HD31]|uniref:DUF4377 domain-containing protein n=1 Tax=Psychrobacter sp. HD31 TaxID=3112003 RepID=UPI003DA245A3
MLNIKKVAVATIVSSTMLAGLVGCQSTSNGFANPFVKKQPVPAPRYIPNLIEGELTKLDIAPQKQVCPSKLPMQCILITRVSTNESILLPYNAIKGFQHKQGERYTLNARPLIDQNNNQATGEWQLVNIVSTTKVDGTSWGHR